MQNNKHSPASLDDWVWRANKGGDCEKGKRGGYFKKSQEEKEKMKMPTGDFKGTQVRQLPSSYLKWVAESWEDKTDKDRLIILAAAQEHYFREKMGLHWEPDVHSRMLDCLGIKEG